jgi:uncharacterized coiled-coil DUF342 family protein
MNEQVLKEEITMLESNNRALREEINQLKENNLAMQEEMARTWAKHDKLKSTLEEIREDIVFCINNMKNEYSCTDSRTRRELHTMVHILEDTLQIIDKAKESDVK